MKEIGKRIWEEPAVAIGLLLSIAMGIITALNGTDWDWNTILLVLGPFLTGIGVRPTVKPMVKIKEEQEQKAREALMP